MSLYPTQYRQADYSPDMYWQEAEEIEDYLHGYYDYGRSSSGLMVHDQDKLGYTPAQEAIERAKVLAIVRSEFPITNNCDYDRMTYQRLLEAKQTLPMDSDPRIRYHVAYDQLILEFNSYLNTSCRVPVNVDPHQVIITPPITEAPAPGAGGGIAAWAKANPMQAVLIGAGIAFVIYKMQKKGRRK